jgi:hypothetical protein
MPKQTNIGLKYKYLFSFIFLSILFNQFINILIISVGGGILYVIYVIGHTIRVKGQY